MGTTSNGKPWGTNFGRVGSGVAYGWSVMKGVKAAQRREPQEADSDWAVPLDAAKVSALWVLYLGIFILHAYLITNATVMAVTAFFDPMRDGSVAFGLTLLGPALFGIAVSVLTIMASRALLARAEHLPPKRGERFLAWRFFPNNWPSLYLLPLFLPYLPLYIINAYH